MSAPQKFSRRISASYRTLGGMNPISQVGKCLIFFFCRSSEVLLVNVGAPFILSLLIYSGVAQYFTPFHQSLEYTNQRALASTYHGKEKLFARVRDCQSRGCLPRRSVVFALDFPMPNRRIARLGPQVCEIFPRPSRVLRQRLSNRSTAHQQKAQEIRDR